MRGALSLKSVIGLGIGTVFLEINLRKFIKDLKSDHTSIITPLRLYPKEVIQDSVENWSLKC